MGFGASGLELQPQAPNLRDTLHRRSKPGTANTPKRRDKTIQSCHKDRERETDESSASSPALQVCVSGGWQCLGMGLRPSGSGTRGSRFRDLGVGIWLAFGGIGIP